MNVSFKHPERPDSVSFLTGQLSASDWPADLSEPGKGGKFDLDGQVLHWPGNTIICHIDPLSKAHRLLTELQNRIKSSEYGHLFTYLPPSSFHMTIFEGWAPFLQEQDIPPYGMTENLTRDASTAKLRKMLSGVVLPRRFRIRVKDLFALHSITVCGADEWQEKSLRNTRRLIDQATDLNRANMEGYVFHISLAYRLKFVDEITAKGILALSETLGAELKDEIGEIELGPCELCEFDSMHHFHPVMYLNDTST